MDEHEQATALATPSRGPCEPDPPLTTDSRVLIGAGSGQGIRWRPGERLHHVFEERCDELAARGLDGHPAVDDGDEVISYLELDRRANRLARYLQRIGVGEGDRVALLFDHAVHAYVSMLAVSKIAAAYVPLDPGFPSDRTAWIARDADVRTVLTLARLEHLLGEVEATPVSLDTMAGAVAAEDGSRTHVPCAPGGSEDLCYLIYTSGTTGRPKGVAVEHRSICNFVRVAAGSYGITATDRVYQGMTIAFDFSVEEIWVPLAAGATLVPKPAGRALLGRELHTFCIDRGVTALCCVPTLLATVEEDLPDLRFLLVSGEACPQDLVTRWHRPGRRFLNVYGPTEATVTATWTPVDPDRSVTLGVPLPTYAVVILDPQEDRSLPRGALGEIGIAGVGLARGYLNRDDLTRRAFIPDFIGIPGNLSGRIYRSGDLGRITAEGEVEYHGRIDTQVKIRGYRIELTEIESVLLQFPGVAQAVVDTHESTGGAVELVGYYTLREGTASVDRVGLLEWLRARLPGYMVPAYLEQLAAIPMLPSDKADRKRLPAPTGPRSVAGARSHVAPATATERDLAEALAAALSVERVSVDSHFFDDLNVNSLLMAHFCARVRDLGRLPAVSMRDVYLHPTVRDLAAVLAPAAAATGPGPEPAPAASPLSPGGTLPPGGVAPSGGGRATRRYVGCGALQLAAFLLTTWVTAVAVDLGYEWIRGADGVLALYVRTSTVGLVGYLAMGFWPVVVKWLLVGRWKPGEFEVWSLRYVRFWAVKALIRSSPFVLFTGSPLYLWYLRALGARIGRGVVILSRQVPVCTDLVSIGDGTVIRKDASFATYRAVDGRIQTGRITLGRDVFVGEKTVLDIGSALGDGAQLGHASALHAGQVVPPGEHWHGSPAQPTTVEYRGVPPARCGSVRRFVYALLQLARMLLLYIPGTLLVIGTVLPRTTLLDPTRATSYAAVLWLSLALFVATTVGGLAVVLTVPRVLHRFLQPGRVYPLYGFHFAVHRTIARMGNTKFYMDLFGDSSYIVNYLRALGYRLDPVEQTGSNFGTELQQESPFLTRVGTGTMVSDALSVLNADISSSSFRVSEVAIAERNYLGNNLAFPTGARVGDNCLLATKAMVPLDGPVRRDVGLLGSPCFEIPRSVERDRDLARPGDERPARLAAKNRHNAATMAIFLLVRWFLSFGLLVIAVSTAHHVADHDTVAIAVGLVTGLLFTVTYAVLAERAVAGFRRLRPRSCSIYDRYSWWHERLWKLLATAPFNGTPFKNVVWRLLGVRIGRRVFDDGCAIPEKTLVTIGDDAMLNAGSVIQCHSLEDGAFKSGHTVIGARCTLGVESFVHYGVVMGDGAVLAPDAFLMKGERVPAGAWWGGNPARDTAAEARTGVPLPRS